MGHTPGVLDAAVADITVMLVLMTMRRVEEGIQLIKANEVCNETNSELISSGRLCRGGRSS